MLQKIGNLFVAGPEKDRHNNINIIRFLAAAMVIYTHMYALTGQPEPVLFGTSVPAVAVRVFFVLSGYLIFSSFLRDENPFRYLVRRVFRIFPGLIFVVCATVLVVGPIMSSLSVGDYFLSPDTYSYFKNCLMYPIFNLPGVFVDNPYPLIINGSLWTLPVEFLMYLVLPCFFVLLRKLGREKSGLIFLTLFFFTARIVSIVFFPDFHFVLWGTDWMAGLILIPYFFAGALFVFWDATKKVNAQAALFATIILATLQFGSLWMTEIINFFLLPYIVMALSFATPALFGRVFAVNDYSYGLYLWAFLVQQLCIAVLGPHFLGAVSYTLFCTVLTLVCAMVSWHLIEKPGAALGKRITAWSRKREVLRVNASGQND